MYSNDFVKFRPSTFFYCKKVNLTFIHAKKVFFFNVVFNGKKVSLTKKIIIRQKYRSGRDA